MSKRPKNHPITQIHVVEIHRQTLPQKINDARAQNNDVICRLRICFDAISFGGRGGLKRKGEPTKIKTRVNNEHKKKSHHTFYNHRDTVNLLHLNPFRLFNHC